MKKLPLKLPLLSVLLTVLLASCQLYDEPLPQDFIEQQFRAMPFFDGIDVPGNVHVTIRQGDRRDIVVEANGRTLRNVDTYVRQNTLVIRKVGGWSSAVDMIVQVPDLRFISVGGNGEVFGENTWIVPNMALQVSGNGIVDIGLDVRDNVDVRLSGSGEVFLEGNARHASYQLSGSGLVQAFNLRANRAEVDLSGSGICEVRAVNNLQVAINGSGRVYFKGFPFVTTRISGRGELLDAN